MKKTDLDIRAKAEKVIATKRLSGNKPTAPSPQKMQKIIHELEVHQVELNMQNEELLKTQEDLNITKKRYFDLYDKAPVGYCTLRNNGTISEANYFASILLGASQTKLINQPMTRFIAREDQDIYYLFCKKLDKFQEESTCELRIQSLKGRIFWVELQASREKDIDQNDYTRMVIGDITERKKYEKELKNLAHYDQLTGLPNRVLLSDRIAQGMSYAKRNNQFLAIIFLDFDGFKEVNDTYGHSIGDKLLVELSKKMNASLRKVDTLARIGGDEFIAVLFDLDDIQSSIPFVSRLLKCVNEKIVIEGNFIKISASIGVTFYPQDDEHINEEQLLRQADQAMYESKISGKNCYNIFNTKQNELVRTRFEDIRAIEKALSQEEFVLFYQPKVNMKTGEVIGFEALIRWQHPQRGLLSPIEFLPTIEGDSLSINLGEWVIHTALKQIEFLQNRGINTIISVNVGAMQFLDSSFVIRLKKILSKHPNIKPSSLEIEILETSKLEDLESATQVIVACNKMGIKFALDDFGTGYSSLTYLKQLPVSTIKIDQSFIRDMSNNPSNLSIIEGIVNLSDDFHRHVIAEGVETLEHGTMLIKLGCDLAQGYIISKPMPVDEIIPWLKKWKIFPEWKMEKLMSKNQYHILYASIEHRFWIQQVIFDIQNNQTAKYINNDIECKFEKLLEKKGEVYLDSSYKIIIAMHQDIHVLIRKLVTLNNAGKHEEAMANIDKLKQKSDELFEKLDLLIR